jgi:ATP-dependent 26S proteasome regulatory subunit
MKDSILHYLNAGFPSLWIQNWDDELMVKELKEIAETGKNRAGAMNMVTWSCTQGFIDVFAEKVIDKTNDPFAALKYIETKGQEYTLFVLKNFHFYLNDPSIIQKVKDLLLIAKSDEKHLIFISPSVSLPPELEKEIILFDTELPNKGQLSVLLDSVLEWTEASIDETTRELLISAALGLSISEAENIFSFAFVKHKTFNEEAIQTISDMKVSMINQTGILEYIPNECSLSDVGGLEELKHWLELRKKAFSPEAKEFGLREPKGILLAGVPGSGKSLTAKAVSSSWNLPLLRFDFGKVFSSLVGETEQKMRNVLKIAESLSPCILWLDEIEKGLSGSSSFNDSGVTSRVFGHFLTWMQENKSSVFIFATANNIALLPPEFLRKGRFDEFFFVDLPLLEEREEIFTIHLSKVKRDPEHFDISFLARKCEGFSGAEIESAIYEALYIAFHENRDISTKDILQSVHQTNPLSETMKEQIDSLRQWGTSRARNANRIETKNEQTKKQNLIKL